jgi:uncharacterized protein YndB with AHSA1/START domain
MATANTINDTLFTTPSDRELQMTRIFDAPRQRVFDAWTNPGHLPHWMIGPGGWTMPICEINLQPHGKWHIVWRHFDVSEMQMRGVYHEIVRGERLVSTESWGGNWPETLNTLVLSEHEGKTTITSTILYPSKEARDNALASGMKEGVSLSFSRLADYLQIMEK